MAVCLPNDLLDEGRCFQCSTDQQFWMMVIQLLCDISASSGGGGIQRVFHFPSDPNGSVVAPDPAIGYGDDGSLWVKTNGVTDSSGWEPLIGAFMPEVNRVADAPVQIVLATNRLDPELVFASTFSSSFVQEPTVAVKKNADSFLKRFGQWFSNNIWVWGVMFMVMFLTESQAQLPPPFIRNILDTNANIVGVGLTIGSVPGTTTLTVTGGGSLTNANPVLLSWLTNGGAAIKTVSAGNGISLTNQGTNIVIASTATGGSGDILTTLVSNEVAVVGATVLTASAFGTMHVLSGATNYTVMLPTAVGNDRRIIGFRVAPGTTGIITLDGDGAEFIDLVATRKIWADEVAILLSDGTGWTKIGGKSIPFRFVGEVLNAVTVPTATVTIIPCDTIVFVSLPQLESGGYFVVPRPGNYVVTAFISLYTALNFPGLDAYASIEINGSGNLPTNPSFVSVVPTAGNAVVGTTSHASVTQTRRFVTNESFALLSYQVTGASMTTRTPLVVTPALIATEIPSW